MLAEIINSSGAFPAIDQEFQEMVVASVNHPLQGVGFRRVKMIAEGLAFNQARDDYRHTSWNGVWKTVYADKYNPDDYQGALSIRAAASSCRHGVVKMLSQAYSQPINTLAPELALTVRWIRTQPELQDLEAEEIGRVIKKDVPFSTLVNTVLPAEVVPALPRELPLGASSIDDLFGKLYAQYEQAIFAYVYRLMGEAEDARDFTQDAFLKAYRKLPDTLAKGNFQPQAWLYRIATNVCLDELRHRKLLKWQPWETFISLFHPSQVARDNPERDILQMETRVEVATVLEQLAPRYRAALMLREYHGLGYEEISAIMGTSRTALKTLLLRARESFRLHYAKEYPKLIDETKGKRVLTKAAGRVSLPYGATLPPQTISISRGEFHLTGGEYAVLKIVEDQGPIDTSSTRRFIQRHNIPLGEPISFARKLEKKLRPDFIISRGGTKSQPMMMEWVGGAIDTPLPGV